MPPRDGDVDADGNVWNDQQGVWVAPSGVAVTGALNTMTSAGNQAADFKQALTDLNNNQAALVAAGGVFDSPAAMANWRTGQLLLSGFTMDGTYVGGPASTADAQAILTKYGGGGAAGTLNPVAQPASVSPFAGAPAAKAYPYEGSSAPTMQIAPDTYVAGDFARATVDTSLTPAVASPTATIAPGAAAATSQGHFYAILAALFVVLVLILKK